MYLYFIPDFALVFIGLFYYHNGFHLNHGEKVPNFPDHNSHSIFIHIRDSCFLLRQKLLVQERNYGYGGFIKHKKMI